MTNYLTYDHCGYFIDMDDSLSQKILPINHARLNYFIAKQEAKREYLASALSVSSMTINRWMTGKTKRIRTPHLRLLAGILNCQPEDLIQKKVFGHPTNILQRRLAQLLVDDEKFGKLAAAEDYDLLENSLELSLNEGFESNLRLKICYYLAVANYKQERYQQAIHWLNEIFSEGNCQDIDFFVRAYQLRAAMYILMRDYKRAEQDFLYLQTNYFDKINDDTLYLICTNFGYFFFRIEQYQKSYQQLRNALDLIPVAHPTSRQNLNRCSTLRLLAECSLQLGLTNESKNYAETYRNLAIQINHEYTLYRAELIEVDFARLEMRFQDAEIQLNATEKNYKNLLDQYFLMKALALYCESGKAEDAKLVYAKALKDPAIPPGFLAEIKSKYSYLQDS